ncbi:MAG TPA: hypothetical protein VEK11_22600 [Thermoanaerobaculia bacterium]|nr:hypothetical protein [Thermoanaerobaculia bacterium]
MHPLPLLLSTALTLASAAVAQEVPLSSVRWASAPGVQEQPQAASDGTNFLIAWRDRRSGGEFAAIHATRVSPEGEMLDLPTGIAIPTGYAEPPSSWTNAPPAVVWTGRLYLVAWSDIASGRIDYVRIDRDGRLLDATPRSLTTAGLMLGGASATNGNGAAVVFTSGDAVEHVVAQLFDAAGEPTARVALPNGVADRNPVIASGGNGYVVAWVRWTGESQEIVTAALSASGALGDVRVIAAAVRTAPLLASGNGGYLLTYVDAEKRIVNEQLDSSGASLRRTYSGRSTEDTYLRAALAPYDGGWLFAYAASDTLELTGVILHATGSVVRTFPIDSTRGLPAAASNGSRTLVAWQPAIGIADDVHSRVLEVQSDSTLLSRSAFVQTHPRLAASPDGFLAIWTETRGLSPQLRAGRIAPDGRALDGEGLLLADRVLQLDAAVVFDGVQYVVAWVDASFALTVQRISRDGQLLEGPEGRVIWLETVADSVAAATNGRETLIAWTLNIFPMVGNSTANVRAIRVKQDGTLDSAELPVASRTMDDHFVRAGAAWNGKQWLVTWNESITQPEGPLFPPLPPVYALRGARISESMQLLDTAPLELSLAHMTEANAVAAGGPADFAVAWSSNGIVFARRIATNGLLGDVVTLGGGHSPSIAWRGHDYVVAWQQSRDLYYAMLSQPAARLALASSPDREQRVALTPLPLGGFAAVFERYATEALYGGASRAFARFFNAAPRGRAVRK